MVAGTFFDVSIYFEKFLFTLFLLKLFVYKMVKPGIVCFVMVPPFVLDMMRSKSDNELWSLVGHSSTHWSVS